MCNQSQCVGSLTFPSVLHNKAQHKGTEEEVILNNFEMHLPLQ